MNTDTRKKIVGIIRVQGKVRPHDLAKTLNISLVGVHKQLKQLIERGEIAKIGSAPLVYYVIPQPIQATEFFDLPPQLTKQINDDYWYITPKGDILSGVTGFIHWAREVNHTKNILGLAEQYYIQRQGIDNQKQNGWLDVSEKITQTFGETALDKVFCLDVYSLPVFGKTKLGQQVLLAKQSQQKDMIRQIATASLPIINAIVSQYNIDSVAYIPPTVPRKTQFMTELEQYLHLPLNEINLIKIKPGSVLIPQKSLSKLTERIDNAKATIYVQDTFPSITKPRVLLIDDAIGSGATLEESAKKIKQEVDASYIVGFGLVSSFKGFDVITDI